MLKKLLLSSLFLLSSSAFAGSYLSKSGDISQISYKNYWGGHACILVQETWFHFKHDESGSDFVKSLVLSAKMAQKTITVASNTDTLANVCGDIDSYALMIIHIK